MFSQEFTLNEKSILLIFFAFIIMSLFLISPSISDEQKSGNVEEFEVVFFEPLFSKYNEYDMIQIRDTQVMTYVGNPALPVKSISILLENPAIKDIEIVSYEKKDIEGNFSIFPAQTPIPLSEKNETRMEFTQPKPSVYRSSNAFPGYLFKNVGIFKMRNYNILNLIVYPIQYNPKEGKITFYKKMKFRITYKSGLKILSETVKEERRESKHFDKLAEKLVVNPEEIVEISKKRVTWARTLLAEPLTTPTYCSGLSSWAENDLKYIIITNTTEFKNEFQKLADWKTKKGVPAKVTTISDMENASSLSCIGLDAQEKIRNFIKDAYDIWGIEWVLLGGDTDIVPHRGGYGSAGGYIDNDIPTDLYYADLDGSWNEDEDSIYGETSDGINLYADVFIGRAPVNTLAEVQTFVNKTLMYEKNPPTDYQTKALFLAEYLSPANGAVLKDYIDTNLLPSSINATKLYEENGNENAAAVISELNQGYNLINHVGHGNTGTLCVGTDTMGNGDMDGLTNVNRYGVFYSLSCHSGNFEGDAIGEHFVLNSGGGGVAYIGNSRYGWYAGGGISGICPDPSCNFGGEYDRDFFTSLFTDGFYHIGETLTDSKNAYVGASGGDGTYRWLQYALNLLGDPELPIWTSIPGNLTVIRPLIFSTNSTTFEVAVKNGSVPVENAVVCLQKGDEIYNCNTTNVNGTITFTINVSMEGEMNITVTALNFLPYENTSTAYSIDTNADILLVDDDGNDSYETYYKDALDAINYSYTTWNVSSKGSPDSTILSNFKIVVWFTGDERNNTMNSTDQANLEGFLVSRGQLFVSGQDIGHDIGDSSFYQNYLHANFSTDNVSEDTIQGIDGEFTEGLTLYLTGGANNNNYPSNISLIGNATSIFNYSYSGIAGLRYNDSTYRVVYLAFPFESINSTSTQADLMNKIMNWFDNTPPNSTVSSLAEYQKNTTFQVSWRPIEGTTDILTYDIEVSDNSDPWIVWQYGVTVTSANYTGAEGHTYKFRSIATDNSGNVESKTSADTSTTIDTISPETTFTLSRYSSEMNFTVTWNGTDATSGMKNYTIQVQDNGGVWTNWTGYIKTTTTSGNYTGINGHTYGFRAKSIDNAGNVETYTSLADALITIDAEAPSQSGDFYAPYGDLNNYPYVASFTTSDSIAVGINFTDSNVLNSGFNGGLKCIVNIINSTSSSNLNNISVVASGRTTDNLTDGNISKNLTFSGTSSQLVYLKLPRLTNVTNATLTLTGFESSGIYPHSALMDIGNDRIFEWNQTNIASEDGNCWFQVRAGTASTCCWMCRNEFVNYYGIRSGNDWFNDGAYGDLHIGGRYNNNTIVVEFGTATCQFSSGLTCDDEVWEVFVSENSTDFTSCGQWSGEVCEDLVNISITCSNYTGDDLWIRVKMVSTDFLYNGVDKIHAYVTDADNFSFNFSKSIPDFSGHINSYLSECIAGENLECDVPINITSGTAGIIEISDINIEHGLYNAVCRGNLSLSGVDDGIYNITVELSDLAGNKAIALGNKSFIYDISGPAINIISPISSGTKKGIILINTSVTDSNTVENVQYKWNKTHTYYVSICNCEGIDCKTNLISSDNIYINVSNNTNYTVTFGVPNETYYKIEFVLEGKEISITNTTCLYISNTSGMQGVGSYAYWTSDQNHTFDLTSYLPDANGEYKITIGTPANVTNATNITRYYDYAHLKVYARGNWTNMSNLSTDYWNASFDTTTVLDDNYTIIITATDSLGYSSTKFITITVNNTLCVENWTCNEWGSCIGSVQIRICTDLNNCGTELNKPAESQSCTTGGVYVGGVTLPTLPTSYKTWNKMMPETTETMKITNPEIGFTEIDVQVKNQVNNVEITVKKLTGKPAEVVNVTGKVYQYISINHKNMEETNIEKATIKFKVNKSWIKDNNIDKTTVVLNRYTTQWNKLPTTLVNESSNFIYYQAIAPGFSQFAISGEEISAAPVCTADEKRCLGDELQQCNVNATSWETVEICTFGCSSTTLICNLASKEICTQNQTRCSGDILQVCSQDMKRWQFLQNCTYRCLDGRCMGQRPSPTVDTLIIVLIAIIAIVGVLGVYMFRRVQEAWKFNEKEYPK